MSDMAQTATLREARQRRKLTQKELERLSGIHQSSLSRYEAGQTVPDWSSVRRLEKALRLKRGDLLVGNEAAR